MGIKVTPKKKEVAKKPSAKAPAKAMPAPRLTAMDREYQAEDDVRTLIRAEEIKKDALRLKRAQSAAKKKADEAMKVARI
jgi:hypothetical protein